VPPTLDAPAEPALPAPPARPPASVLVSDLAPAIALSFGGVVLVMAAYIVATVIALARLPDAPRFALAVAQGAGLLAPALLLVAFARATGLLAPQAPRVPTPAPLALGAATSTFTVAILAGIAWSAGLALAVPERLESMQDQLAAMYGPLFAVDTPLDIAAVLVALSIVPALCEELVFRGFVQRVLRSRLSVAWSVGITSVLFSAFHLDLVGFPSRLLIGISLGLALERTGSLRLPMVMHATHNLFTMLVMPWDVAEALRIPPVRESLVGIAVALPLLVPAAWLWRKTLRELASPGTGPA
jgi:membrane protease YdiL (CAAX protease family)